ncbi:MAG: hypothetical protein RL523_551 [Actinomycetota bacterium]
MNKVVSNCSQSADTQNDGSPVDGFDWATQFVGLNASLIAHGQHVCCSASGIRGFARGNDCLASEISGFEVSFVSSTGSENAWSWGSPGRVLGSNGLNCKRVFSQVADDFRPRNLDCCEGIVDFDTLVAVNDLRHDNENPNNHRNGKAVEKANHGLFYIAGIEEREEGQGNNQVGGNQVNPTDLTSKNVHVLHNFEITGSIPLKSEFTAFSPRKVAA